MTISAKSEKQRAAESRSKAAMGIKQQMAASQKGVSRAQEGLESVKGAAPAFRRDLNEQAAASMGRAFGGVGTAGVSSGARASAASEAGRQNTAALSQFGIAQAGREQAAAQLLTQAEMGAGQAEYEGSQALADLGSATTDREEVRAQAEDWLAGTKTFVGTVGERQQHVQDYLDANLADYPELYNQYSREFGTGEQKQGDETFVNTEAYNVSGKNPKYILVKSGNSYYAATDTNLLDPNNKHIRLNRQQLESWAGPGATQATGKGYDY